jgi:hypothetical protein
VPHFEWSSWIHDPTVGGWLTVVSYFAAVLTTWRTARCKDVQESWLWYMIAILFIGLGMNKQLDLQTALTDIGRALAFTTSWYEQRRIVQLWFIVAVVICAGSLALTLAVLARRSQRPTWLALAGVMAVLCFVLIRAASFHHVDRYISSHF